MEQISLEDINLDIIPIKVLQDVDRRIADWKAFGGKDSDAYIQNQLRHLKQIEKAVNNAMKAVAAIDEFEVFGRIKLRDKKTGKIYR